MIEYVGGAKGGETETNRFLILDDVLHFSRYVADPMVTGEYRRVYEVDTLEPPAVVRYAWAGWERCK